MSDPVKLLLVDDLPNVLYGEDMNVFFAGNLLHRNGAPETARFICWANGPTNLESFTNLPAFRTSTQRDVQSALLSSGTLLTADAVVTDAMKTANAAVPVAVPATVAAYLGVPEGWRGIGPLRAALK